MTNSELARKTAKKLHKTVSEETELDRSIEESVLKIETQIILSALIEAVQEKQEALTKIVAITDCKFAKQIAKEALLVKEAL